MNKFQCFELCGGTGRTDRRGEWLTGKVMVGHLRDVPPRQDGNAEEGYYWLLLGIRAVALSDDLKTKKGKIPALTWRPTSNLHTDKRSAATHPPAANLFHPAEFSSPGFSDRRP